MMFITLLLMAATAILASPITTPYPPSASTSASSCPTTVITFPEPALGPTKTVYTSTVTSVQMYNCGGCDSLVVVQLGHIFPDIPVHYTTTVTEAMPTTSVVALCSWSAAPSNPSFPFNPALFGTKTESSTVSVTSTASLSTITVGGKTGNLGRRGDLGRCSGDLCGLMHSTLKSIPFGGGGPGPVCPDGKCHPTATPAAKSSEDFSDGHQPTRCIDYRTGKTIPGCNDARDVDEPHAHPQSMYTPACWNEITGIFDPAAPSCKITFRSQGGDNKIEERHRHNLTKADCPALCTTINSYDHPAVTTAELAACITECDNLRTCGHLTCPPAKRVADDEIEERQISHCWICREDDGVSCLEVACPSEAELLPEKRQAPTALNCEELCHIVHGFQSPDALSECEHECEINIALCGQHACPQVKRQYPTFDNSCSSGCLNALTGCYDACCITECLDDEEKCKRQTDTELCGSADEVILIAAHNMRRRQDSLYGLLGEDEEHKHKKCHFEGLKWVCPLRG